MSLVNRLRHDDHQWFLDVNKVARHTTWAHGFMAVYSVYAGVAVLAVLLLWAWWRARSRPNPVRAVAKVLWAAGGTVIAWVIGHYVVKPAVGRKRPFLTLHHVEVLISRPHGFSFPSGHATVAGAVIIGLLLVPDIGMFLLAVLFGGLLAFGRIYVGVHYPGDVAAGLVLGALVILLLNPFAVRALTAFDSYLVDRTFLRPMVEAGAPWRPARTKRLGSHAAARSTSGRDPGATS